LLLFAVGRHPFWNEKKRVISSKVTTGTYEKLKTVGIRKEVIELIDKMMNLV
jgi:hypothetical protein